MTISFYPLGRETSQCLIVAAKVINFGYTYRRHKGQDFIMVMFKDKSDEKKFNRTMTRRIQK